MRHRSPTARSPLASALPGLSILVLAFALGCGSAVHYDGRTVQDPHDRTSFQAEDPGDGWRRVNVEGENDLAFVNDDLAAIIQVNASCSAELDIPLPALRNHLLIGFTERELQDEALIELDGREALRTHTRAKLDGVLRELVLVVMKKDGCVYDLALVAPPGPRFEQALPSFERIIANFRAEGHGR